MPRRAVGFATIDGVKHVVEGVHAELLAAMPDAAFHWRGSHVVWRRSCCLSEEKRDSRAFNKGARRRSMKPKNGTSRPCCRSTSWSLLRECRGKSGGMNHAVAVVNGYLHHYSRTMRRVRKRRYYCGDAADAKQVGHLLFAIFDCQHMALEGFWDSIVPQFYRYTNPEQPLELRSSRDQSESSVLAAPADFYWVVHPRDFFDMRNEYLFRMANTVRTGVGGDHELRHERGLELSVWMTPRPH